MLSRNKTDLAGFGNVCPSCNGTTMGMREHHHMERTVEQLNVEVIESQNPLTQAFRATGWPVRFRQNSEIQGEGELAEYFYQIEAGGWSGATSTYSAGASSGDGCNMSTDTHRLTYANKYGDYATKHSGRGHKFSNGVSWKGFSISSTTGTSYSSDFEFDFGVDGGTTNRNYYLCWIDSNDDTLATAKGNIYAYSDALTTALPPII